MREVQLDDSRNDRICWKWTSDKIFTTSSAYRPFFIGQHPIKGAKILQKCARQRNASSLSGWYSMIVVGRQIGVSAVAYKMMTPVSCAIRCRKLQITCCWVARSPEKSGSKGYVGLVGKLSLLTSKLAILQIGGLLLGRAFPRMCAGALTLLWSWSAGFFGKKGTIGPLIAECKQFKMYQLWWPMRLWLGAPCRLQVFRNSCSCFRPMLRSHSCCHVIFQLVVLWGLVPLLCNQS